MKIASKCRINILGNKCELLFFCEKVENLFYNPSVITTQKSRKQFFVLLKLKMSIFLTEMYATSISYH